MLRRFAPELLLAAIGLLALLVVAWRAPERQPRHRYYAVPSRN